MSNFVIPLQASERVTQLGQRFRVARIRRGWSVVDLASKAGINRNRSGSANLNSAISGNSGHDAGLKLAWREGVFDGEEIRPTRPALLAPSISASTLRVVP